MPPKLEGLPLPWPSFLKEIDSALTAPVELHCLGGFVLAVLYGLPRPTDDLDYISILPKDSFGELESIAGRGSKLCKHHKVSVQHVGAIPIGRSRHAWSERSCPLCCGGKTW